MSTLGKIYLLMFGVSLQDLWWTCVSACVRYGGGWMVQILGHTLKNWLLIMYGWPCLSDQAMYGALPMCCLLVGKAYLVGTWSWN